MRKLFLLFVAATLMGSTSYGQVKVRLKTGEFVNTQPQLHPGNSSTSFQACLYEGNYHVWLQFNQIPTDATKQALAAAGIRLLQYVPNNTYIATIPATFSDYQRLAQWQVYSVMAPVSYAKIDPTLRDASSIQWAVLNDTIRKVTVVIDKSVATTQAVQALQQWVPEFKYTAATAADAIEAEVSMRNIELLAKHPLVHYIEPISAPATIEDIQATTAHRNTNVNTSDNFVRGRKLNGSGVVITMGDDGFVGPHVDFAGRIEVNAIGNSGSHGDHVAGIITGAGNWNPTVVGNAPGATLRVYDNYNDLNQIPNIYTFNNVRLTSHSLGQSCNAGYNTDARNHDIQLRTYPALMHVHSAGNSGGETCGGISGGWRTITGGLKASKNSMAVANVTKTDAIAGTSSKGPTPDGRIKPDIAAVGTNVNSTQPSNLYTLLSGTSMACPAVTGNLAVLYQAFRLRNNGNDPNAGLIKAIALNTADDLGNPGPDFTFGWGRINTLRAVECIEQNRYLSGTVTQGQTVTHNINVPANVATAKIMTYWVDPEAFSGAAVALVNNINTRVTNAGGSTVYHPWIMDAGLIPTAFSCAAPAVVGSEFVTDNINNVEQVQLDNPAAGNYTLSVRGESITDGPQTYFVVIEYYYNNNVRLVYPFGGESFVPGELQRIRWDASAVSATFALDYTTDGATWLPITSNLSSSTRHFDWTVPSITTGSARVRVRIARDGITSESDTVFAIVGVPTINNITATCAGTSTVEVAPVPGATAYDVIKLGDRFMEQVATSTSPTILVSGIVTGAEELLAVRARVGGMRGRRSLPQSHINLSNATCALPLQLLHFSGQKQNKQQALLTWETAFESELTQFVVERSTDANFSEVTIVGTAQPRNTAQQSKYQVVDTKIFTAGTYYYRLRTDERTRTSYSRIVAINFTEVNTAMQVYPQPAKDVFYIMSNGNYPAAQIMLHNASGKVVYQQNMGLRNGVSVTVPVGNVASGVYYLTITNATDKQVVYKGTVTIL